MRAISACGRRAPMPIPGSQCLRLDFVQQAKDKKYVVPEESLRRGAEWFCARRQRRIPSERFRACLCVLRAWPHGPPQSWATCAISAIRAQRVEERNRGRARRRRCRRGRRQKPVRPLSFSRARRSCSPPIRRPIRLPITAPRARPRRHVGARDRKVDRPRSWARASDARERRRHAGSTRRPHRRKRGCLRAAWELTRERTRLDIVVNGKPAVPPLGRCAAFAIGWDYFDAGSCDPERGDAPIWRGRLRAGHAQPAATRGSERPHAQEDCVDACGSACRSRATETERPRHGPCSKGRWRTAWRGRWRRFDLLPAGLEIEMPLAGDDGQSPIPGSAASMA